MPDIQLQFFSHLVKIALIVSLIIYLDQVFYLIEKIW